MRQNRIDNDFFLNAFINYWHNKYSTKAAEAMRQFAGFHGIQVIFSIFHGSEVYGDFFDKFSSRYKLCEHKQSHGTDR